jgi:hypothetical protein
MIGFNLAPIFLTCGRTLSASEFACTATTVEMGV